MDNRIFTNIMVATDGSELARKAVDSAIKLAQLNKAKLYAVHVIALGETKVTQHDPRDAEWEKYIHSCNSFEMEKKAGVLDWGRKASKDF